MAQASRLCAAGRNFQNLYPSSVASNQPGGQATLPATEHRFTALRCDVDSHYVWYKKIGLVTGSLDLRLRIHIQS